MSDYQTNPLKAFLEQDHKPRICALQGTDGAFSPDFAAVVISEDW